MQDSLKQENKVLLQKRKTIYMFFMHNRSLGSLLRHNSFWSKTEFKIFSSYQHSDFKFKKLLIINTWKEREKRLRQYQNS